MNKKIGVIGLLFFVLILMPIILAVEIKVVAKPERNVVVSVLDANGDSIASFSNSTDSNGIIIFDYETVANKIDINVVVRNNGKFEYGGPKIFEDQKTIRTIVIDLERIDIEVNETESNETVELIEEEPVVAEEVQEEIVEEPVVEEVVEEPVVEVETKAGLTGAAVTENVKSYLSKTVVYIIIIAVIIVVAILAFIFRKKIGKKGSAGFKIKKMSDMKKDDKKTPPKDPADYDRRLDNAEEKLKEAKEELDELRERKRKLEEVRSRYEKDREELKDMGELD